MIESELQKLFPHKKIEKEDIELVNKIIDTDDEVYIKGAILDYRYIFIENEDIKFSDFIHALKFVTFINSGMDIVEAYKKTFAYSQNLQEKILNRQSSIIKAEATSFSKSKLVLLIAKEANYPLDILYQGYKYQAIEVLRNEMHTAKISRDKIQAANILLTHLSPKLEQNINLNFHESKPKSAIDIYKEALAQLAEEQSKMIDATIDNESKSKIINVKLIEQEKVKE